MNRYESRIEAGRALAGEIVRLELGACVVAGLLRGGLVVAQPIARQLAAPLVPLDIRRLFSPAAPEDAFGAVDEDGHTVLDYRAMVTLGLGTPDVEHVKARAMDDRARSGARCPRHSAPDVLEGRAVVVVDDALATSLDIQAAIAYAQRHRATAVVVAVPCASDRAAYEVTSLLGRSEDRLVCPLVDPAFRAASDYYRDFREVSDEDVARILDGPAVV